MSQIKMEAVKELVFEKRYDEARVILRSIDHPKAVALLEKIDRVDPPKSLTPVPIAEVEDETVEHETDSLITPNHEKHSRYPKAVAGEFDGIQFRSQLEIRFAAELKKRSVAYEYEPARIGKGNYLIDFHLPDHAIWVEVKGKMDARDEYLLQECAEYLLTDQLYLYSSDRKMHRVHGDSLEYLWPGKFWDMLEEKQSQKN
jgi:hypothetical protein